MVRLHKTDVNNQSDCDKPVVSFIFVVIKSIPTFKFHVSTNDSSPLKLILIYILFRLFPAVTG